MESLDLIYKIFFKDGSWLTILNGLWVTVQISALALLLGTIFGSLLCFFRVGKFKPLKVAAQVYISIIRG
ncbi:MAG: amino acid ABC transporter permease, partial [Selenomonadaceae bacterium]|nr:amino acid ABC transporter permease [Selenomonadaceae bacterium]